MKNNLLHGERGPGRGVSQKCHKLFERLLLMMNGKTEKYVLEKYKSVLSFSDLHRLLFFLNIGKKKYLSE